MFYAYYSNFFMCRNVWFDGEGCITELDHVLNIWNDSVLFEYFFLPCESVKISMNFFAGKTNFI